MANLANTLLPPVLSTFMPAFLAESDEGARVYFSYSPFSSNSREAYLLHVTVVDQLSNQNALADGNEVLFYSNIPSEENKNNSVQYDENKQMYFIVISKNKIAGGSFVTEKYYKIQMRLDCTPQPLDIDNSNIMVSTIKEYLTSNLVYFSEWSSVCLIRAIAEPFVTLNSFLKDGTTFFNRGSIPVIGKMQLTNSSSEKIQSYIIKVFDNNSDLVYTSETLFPEQRNEIYYFLESRNFTGKTESTAFVLDVEITTNNLFVFSSYFNFEVGENFLQDPNYDPFDPTITVEKLSDSKGTLIKDENNEYILPAKIEVDEKVEKRKIRLYLDQQEGFAYFYVKNGVANSLPGNIFVKRASSKTDFQLWEDFKVISLKEIEAPFSIKVEDHTVEPYVSYRYSIQYITNNGLYTAAKEIYSYDALGNPVSLYVKTETTTLIRKDKHLNLLYGCKVSNFKETVSRTKIDTLGGHFPKFVENNNMKYKEFSLSGTISGEADFNQRFLNKETFLSSQYSDYERYLENEKIVKSYRNDVSSKSLEKVPTTTMDDIWWEKVFRDEVLSWLNDGKPKLFKSLTEGNIPIILMNVSLTPKEQLGRRLYDFSATAYQIGDGSSLNDLMDLGIIGVCEKPGEQTGSEAGGKEEDSWLTVTKAGSFKKQQGVIARENQFTNIIEQLIAFENENALNLCCYNKSLITPCVNENLIENYHLRNIKLYFTSSPHYYYFGSSSSENNEGVHYDPKNADHIADGAKIKQGYQFKVKNAKDNNLVYIFVNKNGFYQIPNNTQISELYLNNRDEVYVEYIADYDEKQIDTLDSLVAAKKNKEVIGQERGAFDPEVFLGKQIKKKYDFIAKGINNDDFNYKVLQMSTWKGIFIETEPYAQIQVKTPDGNAKNYSIGFTGKLSLPPALAVEDLAFCGKKFFRKDLSPKDYKYIPLKDFEYAKIEDNTILVPNGVYNGDRIYYKGNWYPFEENLDFGCGIGKVPIDGTVNYRGVVWEYIW